MDTGVELGPDALYGLDVPPIFVWTDWCPNPRSLNKCPNQFLKKKKFFMFLFHDFLHLCEFISSERHHKICISNELNEYEWETNY
jgi:hypothetical protein